ncbi:hypothetical protein [Ruminococcus flavefaciens]|uniref:Uncharacterized protein n=1 Tax=Ruminococcus flavefaciens TaxID=1265 RepID=A0A315XX29_RUMFL|nr:hypothetical protein [Ruminococcus flavefaciens]PWJ11945.1 hypothetical protein IE37_02210 [Ruminococcus flavefaciens]SSA50234.1 hypothetical protein SAMN02910325_02210 [Ruminococcus flavefaciens]
MEVLHLSKNTDYYFFYFKIWGRRNRIKIMSDSESEIKHLFRLMTDNLKLIDKNKDKIAQKIYENRYSTNYQYQDDLIDIEIISNAPNALFQHFVNGLYISNVRIELYNNMEFDVIFTVKSKYRYRVDFGEECVLYFDHSFEV